MSIAFVVGNGTSRSPINLSILKNHGTVYACNAVYREFSPDYLVAVDPKMVVEICENNYQLKNKVWTNDNRRYQKYKNLNYFEPSQGWSSGPTALWLASQHKHETIYILGFDYKGLDDGKRVNYIFAGTKNYKAKDANATYYGNWLRQTKKVITDNRNINYVRVIAPNSFNPPELEHPNYTTLDIKNFLNYIENNKIIG